MLTYFIFIAVSLFIFLLLSRLSLYSTCLKYVRQKRPVMFTYHIWEYFHMFISHLLRLYFAQLRPIHIDMSYNSNKISIRIPNQAFPQFPAIFYPQILVPIITAAPTRYTCCTLPFNCILQSHPHIFIVAVSNRNK